MKMVVTLAVLAVAAVFGLRVLVATYAWKGCGMPGDAAFIRAVIGLGAQPGVLECAGAALAQPSVPSPTSPPPTTNPPPTTEDPAVAEAQRQAEYRQCEAKAKQECADEDAALRAADTAYETADRKLDNPKLSDAEYERADAAWQRAHDAWSKASSAVDQCYFDHGVPTPID